MTPTLAWVNTTGLLIGNAVFVIALIGMAVCAFGSASVDGMLNVKDSHGFHFWKRIAAIGILIMAAWFFVVTFHVF